MKEDDFRIIALAIILMIIALAAEFLILLKLPEGRLYDVSLAMLPVLPSIILIVATMAYVKATFNLQKETQLQRKKPFIEDMVKKILLSIDTNLKLEIDTFDTKYFIHLKEQKYETKKFNIKDEVFVINKDIYYKVFAEQYSNLYKKVKKHDEEKVPELEKAVTNFIKKIYTNEFKIEWENKLHFCQGQKHKVYQQNLSTMLDRLLESIIHGQKCALGTSCWNKYEKEILKMRGNYNSEIEAIYSERNNIKSYVKNLREELIDLIKSELIIYGVLPTRVNFD